MLKLLTDKDILVEAFASFLFAYYTQTYSITYAGVPFAPIFTTSLLIFMLIVLNHCFTCVHFNPAITLSYYAAGRFSLSTAIGYVLAQFIGGGIGSTLVYFATAAQGSNETVILQYALEVGPGTSNASILITEIIGTMVLCLAALLATYHPKFSDATGALMVAMTVHLGISAGAAVGGGCLNPLRTFAPWMATFSPSAMLRNITHNWTFHLGPYLGGLLAAAYFKAFWMNKKWLNTSNDKNDEVETEALNVNCN